MLKGDLIFPCHFFLGGGGFFCQFQGQQCRQACFRITHISASNVGSGSILCCSFPARAHGTDESPVSGILLFHKVLFSPLIKKDEGIFVRMKKKSSITPQWRQQVSNWRVRGPSQWPTGNEDKRQACRKLLRHNGLVGRGKMKGKIEIIRWHGIFFS